MDCSPPGLCPWDFPGKNTGVGCHFLLQGTFLTQGSNPWLLPLLLHCRQILYRWATKELPEKSFFFFKLPSLYYLSWQPLQTHTQSISSVQFSRSVMSLSLQPHESQHARPPCPQDDVSHGKGKRGRSMTKTDGQRGYKLLKVLNPFFFF